MHKFNRFLKAMFIACLISMIVACGQKGDLYMPESSTYTLNYYG
jgi:predicted small lipoprotein YifL